MDSFRMIKEAGFSKKEYNYLGESSTPQIMWG